MATLVRGAVGGDGGGEDLDGGGMTGQLALCPMAAPRPQHISGINIYIVYCGGESR